MDLVLNCLVLNSSDGRYIKDAGAQAVAGQPGRAGLRTVVRDVEWATPRALMAYGHAAGPACRNGWDNTTGKVDRTNTAFPHAGEVFGTSADPAVDRLPDGGQVSLNPARRGEPYARVARPAQEGAQAPPLSRQVDPSRSSRRVEWEARSDARLEMRTVLLTPGLRERR